mmetsp:Transcript_6468/g.24327  ORF Transcript_6468/g.24327 Transcript_6468/m.24327 type:complete len:152 (-) Transcript_6468:215-670(-)
MVCPSILTFQNWKHASFISECISVAHHTQQHNTINMPANNDKIDDYVPYPVNGQDSCANDKEGEGYMQRAKGLLASGYHAVVDGIENAAGVKNEQRTKKAAQNEAPKSHAACSGWNCPSEHAFAANQVSGMSEVFEHPEKFDGNDDNCKNC